MKYSLQTTPIPTLRPKIRTKSTKVAETMAFEKLPSVSILIGASKELWKRHSEYFWITACWTTWAVIVWVKWF